MEHNEKVREGRIRDLAEERGYALAKGTDDKWVVFDLADNHFVTVENRMTLAEVERHIEESSG